MYYMNMVLKNLSLPHTFRNWLSNPILTAGVYNTLTNR